jgi:hypothetical protein
MRRLHDCFRYGMAPPISGRSEGPDLMAQFETRSADAC